MGPPGAHPQPSPWRQGVQGVARTLRPGAPCQPALGVSELTPSPLQDFPQCRPSWSTPPPSAPHMLTLLGQHQTWLHLWAISACSHLLRHQPFCRLKGQPGSPSVYLDGCVSERTHMHAHAHAHSAESRASGSCDPVRADLLPHLEPKHSMQTGAPLSVDSNLSRFKSFRRQNIK